MHSVIIGAQRLWRWLQFKQHGFGWYDNRGLFNYCVDIQQHEQRHNHDHNDHFPIHHGYTGNPFNPSPNAVGTLCQAGCTGE
ncbi:hypothetical protein VSS37_18715 [Candidatus Thiothrix sp. Deng01]|uniref:Uncharacterized protein n=1 Tax=Candidatus Thiothrix phosphatis TaxID=3112415 RepID=A0ABU6D1S6_9GAMM|nr:hypothetical protein [Candidatus Thiothrix sp. Deng01]MEB4593019.1 hypothetical protein [Candidatus Thiothrix sp. Deng01]